ncbi:hypothetical protein [Amycolatopsis sp. NPDC051371]|uniref:hypothetical protein n=1 Tax=Amycolatopsis sp. NPDC051371 TaxID=3155800 RepID=UPI0034251F27
MPEDGGDEGDPAGVPGEGGRQQPSRRRAAVEERPEDRPAHRGGRGQAGEQRGTGVRAFLKAEQEESGAGQLVTGPRQRCSDQVTP